MNLSEKIKEQAYLLGFNIVKIIPAESLPEGGRHFKEWLKKGLAADLEYMKKTPEKRFNPAKILPEAKSVICLAVNYYQEQKKPSSTKNGLIARYAWGRDYHKVLEKKLKQLRKFIIENSDSKIQDFKLYTDAGPVLERAYAEKAGIGFTGKNTTLITQKYGSWVFLSEIITTLELDYDKPSDDFKGSCGTCRKCIDACPAKAIIKPYVIDARKCISYQTIENKNAIPAAIRGKMKNRIFGCDICQEVCPHNSRAKTTHIIEFINHISGPQINPRQIISMTEAQFNSKFSGSPLKRAGHKGIIRNIQHML